MVLNKIKNFIKETESKYFYQRPSKKYRNILLNSLSNSDKIKLQSDFDILDRDGVLIMPEYFKKALPNLKDEFENFISNYAISIGRKQNGEDDGKEDIGHYSVNSKGLANSPYTSLIALDEYLTRLVSYYWGKPVNWAQMSGTRIEPLDVNEDYRAMKWHHDGNYKQIKVFVLLTDTHKDHQCTHFIPRTHKEWKPKSDKFGVSQETINNFPEPIYAAGKAGTIIIANTNGYHRGNRNNTKRRDMLIFNYTAGRSIWPISLPDDVLIKKNYSWLSKNNLTGVSNQNN